jgi:hypothetical protein
MAALGIDIGGVDDFDTFISYATSPAQAAAEAVMCSLLHEPGALWWAPDRGTPIFSYLHRDASADEIQIAVAAEAEKEERVESAIVVATKLGDELQLRIELTLTQDEGRVTLTLAVSAVGEVLAATVEV